jgi:biotin carboxyl carrier protein
VTEENKFSQIALENGVFETQVTRKFGLRKPYQKQNPGILRAVIPGVVAEIGTETGQSVRQGDTLMILEAMKMLNRIKSPKDGRVKLIRVKKGEKVSKGQVLIEID